MKLPQCMLGSGIWCYKFGGGGSPRAVQPPPALAPPPALPPKLPTTIEIGSEAMKAGQEERKRVRGRRGRRSTILTKPGLRPVTTQQAALKTTLG